MWKANEAEIVAAVQKDLGRPEVEAWFVEWQLVQSDIELYVKRLEQWLQPKKVSGNLLNFPSWNYTYRDPLGTVLIIAPWVCMPLFETEGVHGLTHAC